MPVGANGVRQDLDRHPGKVGQLRSGNFLRRSLVNPLPRLSKSAHEGPSCLARKPLRRRGQTGECTSTHPIADSTDYTANSVGLQLLWCRTLQMNVVPLPCTKRRNHVVSRSSIDQAERVIVYPSL